MGLPIRIELANLVAVQCLHDADPREHRRAARLRDQEQRLHGRLPFRRLVLGLTKFGDVDPGILQRGRARGPRGSGIGSSNVRFQPRLGTRPPIMRHRAAARAL